MLGRSSPSMTSVTSRSCPTRSREWLIRVQKDAQQRRVVHLCEWLAFGVSFTTRFDNCDVGKLLHLLLR